VKLWIVDRVLAAGDYAVAVGVDSGQGLFVILLGPPLFRPAERPPTKGVDTTAATCAADGRQLAPRRSSGRPSNLHDLVIVEFEPPPAGTEHLEVRFVAKTGGVGDPVEHHIRLKPLT
jgi:hypothetical protein